MDTTPKVALLIETSSSYGRGLLRGIAKYARLHGPWSFYVEPGALDNGQAAAPFNEWGVDGIIARIHTRKHADQILKAKVPTVDLDYVLPDLFPWGIANNDEGVGELAADHLINCGFKYFAYCGWGLADDSTAFWENARQRKFRQTLEQAGLEVFEYQWPKKKADREWAREQKLLAAWLKDLPKPVGLLAANDQRGRHVIEAARIAGVKVPDEVAVLGVDNDEVMCEICTPSLSSVSLNTRRIGYKAAELLGKLIHGDKVPEKPAIIEPLGVVARESTDTLALDDRQIADAVRFIRNNCHRPIQVSDVLDAVPVSRKTLEVRFQKALGRTPHAEIQRLRLDRVKQLLVQTDWPLKRVANSSGFTYAEHMHAVFRNHMGMTPNEYRAMHSGG
ncbi:MAG: helix-turn-helix domain-containing protein [Phycisphaera sp.]|nr:helix-turn-helix domain-containing protein [Phycisphaera sp.]